MNGWACSIAGIHCDGTFLSLLPSEDGQSSGPAHRESQVVVRRIAALLHEGPDDLIEGRPEIGDHVREDERQLRGRRFPNHEPTHEPPRRISFAAYRVRHCGYPLVQGAVPCRAVLLGPGVLDPQCVETIHGGSLPFSRCLLVGNARAPEIIPRGSSRERYSRLFTGRAPSTAPGR